MNSICKFLASMMVTGLLTTSLAQAKEVGFQTVSLGSLTLNDSQTKSLSLGQARYIRNLVISAEGVGDDSQIEVMVNGIVKGTIYAPGRDPSYIVTVTETASSIQFRHRSGGSMRLHDVLATVSNWQGHQQPEGDSPSLEEDSMRSLAQRTLSVLENLQEFISPADEALYFSPIKRQAGIVLAYAGAKGEHSNKAMVATKALQYQIAFARNFIEDLMESEATFNDAVELINIQESIGDMLD